MNRRQVLKGVAVGSVMSLGIGTATARTRGGVESAENLETVHVAGADGKVVRTVEDPTEADLDRLRAETGAAEQLVSPECTTKCKDECVATNCCGYICECDSDGNCCDGSC